MDLHVLRISNISEPSLEKKICPSYVLGAPVAHLVKEQ
jgi:hypothetical protein